MIQQADYLPFDWAWFTQEIAPLAIGKWQQPKSSMVGNYSYRMKSPDFTGWQSLQKRIDYQMYTIKQEEFGDLPFLKTDIPPNWLARL